MSIAPPHSSASDLVEELVRFDPALAADRDLVRRVVESMVSERPDAAMRPGFRAELRSRLLAAAATPARAPVRPAGSFVARWRSFFFGSGFGTVFGGLVAYAFFVLAAPISPGIAPAPAVYDIPNESLQNARIVSDASGSTETNTATGEGSDLTAPLALTGTAAVSGGENSSSFSVPASSEISPALITWSGGASGTSPETVSNRVKNSTSDTAASDQRSVPADESQPVATMTPKAAPESVSEDPFSLSDIFRPTPDGAVSSMMADSQPAPADPSSYNVVVSSGALAEYADVSSSGRSYAVENARVVLPKSLVALFPASSRLSLRYMTVADDSPYGLTYSLDPVGGSVFASKNDAAWSQPVAFSGVALPSEAEILETTDALARSFRQGALSFWSGTLAPDTATLDVVTVQYDVFADGSAVYESYGAPRAATVSYDRTVRRIAGFSVPRVAGFAKTADVFLRPDMSSVEAFVQKELANRGYAAAAGYDLKSVKSVLSTVPDNVDPSMETLVPALLLEVTATDGSVRETLVMPFGK